LYSNKLTNFERGKQNTIRKLSIYPVIVKKNGIFLMKGLRNSASNIVASKATKIELPNEGVPRPKKNSLNRNPAKILPKPKTKSGIIIAGPGS